MSSVRQDRRDMATIKQIREHWAPYLVECEKFDSIDEVMDSPARCFACGFFQEGEDGRRLTLERSHILARCYGGPNTADNLHVLCKPCHKSSEVLHGEAYWRWFHTRNWLDVALQQAANAGLNLSMFLRNDYTEMAVMADLANRCLASMPDYVSGPTLP